MHIDLPTRAQIEKLIARRAQPTVSIYVATTPVTQEAQIDRIELKNLLKTAVAEMEAFDTPKRAIWPIEEAVGHLIEDDAFWAHQANSLAIFASGDWIETYRLPSRLVSMVEVSDRVHVKPLLRAVTFPHNAYVLAISVGAVRLIEVSADLPPEEVRVPGLPKDFNQALGKRSHTENRKEMASGESTSESALLNRYARVVDAALKPFLRGHERPLIVAASETVASVYRSVSTYPHTARQTLSGSFDHTPLHEIATAARSVLDEVYAAEIGDFVRLYAEREAQGRATNDVAQAARAATFGAVDTLIVDMDETVHGTVADDDGAVAFADGPSAGAYGVVDEIAVRTLRAGGRVLSARRADVPGEASLAAILRYPV
ncbi:hypothetical protein [Amaricoccus sp.]|uniref:baeRF11 domain-containing protein n=1 Tax=Amaricoccus sp. TaxID=1872485 RepID=UPI001B56EDD2|nr:hypothetical protein [Amaricoccus sp.]MBP7242478.1 hypothetical protein [Amaricoccus sp.]